MTVFLVTAFLILHGLLHLCVWATPVRSDKPPPFDPGHSWVLTAAHVSAAPARVAVLLLAWFTTLVYVLAGAGVAAGAQWGPAAAVVAAMSGLVLKVIWFHPWLTFGVLLDAGVIAAVGSAWPGSLY
ncbi:MAG TPA: hypothetical protein VFH94_28625 [Streptomyces sp.]|nr:hypothetical protein [Streptomyces sp.]